MTADEEFIPSVIATTASGSFPEVMSAGSANELFSKTLNDVTVDCVKAGARMIGHIKANIRSVDDFLSMSSTTDDGNVRFRSMFMNDVKEYSMTINAIVYGLDRYRMAEIIVSNMKRMLAGVEIEVHSEVGCEDPGCRDPLCQNKSHKRINVNI